MSFRTPLILALLALAALSPAASAQNDTTPSPDPSSELPGERESVEGQPGMSYGWAVLLGTLAVTGVLAYVTRKRRPKH